MKSSLPALIAILVIATTPAIADPPPGWFGVRYTVATAGFFKRTIEAATVTDIVRGSPAAASTLAPGDQIIEVEGLAVAGSDAGKLAAAMRKAPGDVLHLRVRRPSGEIYEVSLIAASRR